jgi:hypothetical protein
LASVADWLWPLYRLCDSASLRLCVFARIGNPKRQGCQEI